MKKQGILFGLVGFAVLATGLALTSCGKQEQNGGGKGKGDGTHPPTSVKRTAFPKADAKYAITGVVKFVGATPERLPVDVGKKDAFCTKQSAKDPIRPEEVVVNEHEGFKTLRDVYVRVKKFPAKWTFDNVRPDKPVVIEQDGCRYVPHVAAIMVGQTLKVTNDDDTTHNVLFSGDKSRNRSWNKQSNRNQVVEEVFTASERGSLKCKVHGWMNSILYIKKHPFHAVTGDDGSFTLPLLPAGKYVIEARHAALGKKMFTIEVGPGKSPKPIEFTYKVEG